MFDKAGSETLHLRKECIFSVLKIYIYIYLLRKCLCALEEFILKAVYEKVYDGK